MNMSKNSGLKYGLITSLFFILTVILILNKGLISIRGLFWNFDSNSISVSQLELKKDLFSCKIDSDKCKLEDFNSSVNFGVYDFNNTFDNSTNIAFDHYFFDWNDAQFINSLNSIFSAANDHNRWVLLTVEPYDSEPENLFNKIRNGQYDNNIAEICTAINESPNPVFVRWGHEMERVTGRYPWATDNESDYIYAYNYFVEKCREVTENAFYVWSPAGESNSSNYWPGSNNVDYVGLSLYIYEDFELDTYGRVRSFEEAFSERYYRFDTFGKPIILAEFGINLNQKSDYWWFNASKSFTKFPLLKTIVYFNAIDSENVWPGYSTPDWSVDPLMFPGI